MESPRLSRLAARAGLHDGHRGPHKQERPETRPSSIPQQYPRTIVSMIHSQNIGPAILLLLGEKAGMRASYIPAKPLISIADAATMTFPSLQMTYPQTKANPTSTLAHPKSTVDLGCEQLIRVENGLRSPLSPTRYRPISGPKIKESNQNQTAAHQKIYSASLLIQVEKIFSSLSRISLPPARLRRIIARNNFLSCSVNRL